MGLFDEWKDAFERYARAERERRPGMSARDVARWSRGVTNLGLRVLDLERRALRYSPYATRKIAEHKAREAAEARGKERQGE